MAYGRSHRRVSNKRIYGIALIVVMLFKFLMTWLLDVTPDPMLTTINLAVGCVGVVLLMLGRRDQRKYNDERNPSEFRSTETEQSW